ncbi:hypothetical protein DPEC_G00344890 [Dallia pectoralis]|uniref:Uncharacterized protein n=1 Tax=Dallia pectoralis TaxID=75939 RepID=A0ACC2F3E3_DALPE|nr:hypothetical protein DPEC_G00344890 [Dallia pectoralis]
MKTENRRSAFSPRLRGGCAARVVTEALSLGRPRVTPPFGGIQTRDDSDARAPSLKDPPGSAPAGADRAREELCGACSFYTLESRAELAVPVSLHRRGYAEEKKDLEERKK